MKSSELIFVPAPGAGHIVSILEFARRMLDQDEHLLITVLVMKFPYIPYSDAYAKSLTASQPRIQLISLPDVDPPPSELYTTSVEAYIWDFIERQVPHVQDIVTNIISSRSNTGTVRVAGLVLDLFCVPMIDVADEFGLPSFIFLTCNAGFLGLMMYFSYNVGHAIPEFGMSDPELSLPGFANPVPPRVFPGALFNKHGGCAAYVNIGKRFKDAKAILVNTCAELEPHAIEYFLNDGGKTPQVYPVGPVLHLKAQPNSSLDAARWNEIKRWLDQQPESSVVFLCFGSGGSFDAPQVKEIALGLEQSEQKFLWSMRVPPSSDFKNPEEMLPQGFLERIQGRGMICGWAAQVEVLAHKAIGGFVSHCGWNSILESLWHGVPIATFPIYAEQQLNAFEMVKELALAVELKMDYRMDGDLVKADEVARAVRCVMQSDSQVRKKVKAKGELARKAVMDGGSSFTSLARFVKDVVASSS
ncbi:hypothetical protein Tsubulata_003577 [Turnera subulata]|uniref:Glycosyltransferase n=1 Tax=Turnera subulata TaxID=218843 RepID=A0A9Q0FQ71_9ROSI|nr:hypothetical protein Tsubulata_003577 [Turnera subulata]